MVLEWFLRVTLVAQIVGNLNSKEPETNNIKVVNNKKKKNLFYEGFRMPLHYPRYKKEDYAKMEEWKVDQLLREYGLDFEGSLEEKREFAMGAFLWPDQI
ncbi:hypothetical protein LUZ60_005608 [Juncus effusus]|nr:hypothetical protein LUZ60_005608 [Juncus effusus]